MAHATKGTNRAAWRPLGLVALLAIVHVVLDVLAAQHRIASGPATALSAIVLLAVVGTGIVAVRWARHAAQAHDLSDRRLALAVQASGVGMWDLDLERGTTFNDDRCREIYGIPEVPADGVTAALYDSLVHPDDAAARLVEMLAFESDPSVRHHTMTFRMVRPDGAVVWITDTGAILRDERGRPIRKIGFSQDVTAERQLLDQVTASADRLALAAEAAGLGAWEYDAGTGRAVRDATWRALHGTDTSPEGWSEVAQFVHPDDRGRLEHERERVIESGTPGVLRYRIVRASDGEVRWVENWMAARTRGGEVSSLVGFVLDVTDRELAVAQLAASEARFRALAKNLPDTIYRLRVDDAAASTTDSSDERGMAAVYNAIRFDYVSPAVHRLTGLTADEVLAAPHLVFERIVPEDRHLFAQMLERPGPCGPVVLRCVLEDGSVTWSEHRGFATFRPDGRLVAVDAIARDITLTKRYEAQLEHETSHDALTALPTRETFLARLDLALAADPDRATAVIAIHLDRVSYVSDVFGQQAGDALVRDAAERLRRALRPGELLGRTGATEFALALQGASTVDGAEWAELVTGLLARPFLVAGTELVCGAMAGVAAASGVGSADVALDHARAALARAKAALAERVALFEPAALDEMHRRRAVGGDLQRALELDELRLFVQPEVDLRSGRVVGGEALLRWQSPERGLVLPGEFVPLAEQLGLERAIGRWVVTTACTMAARLRATVAPDFVLRCNLSALELVDGTLPDQVAAALRNAGLTPDALCLEVTETAVLADLDAALANIRRLKDLGVGLALDDFGTGYSSLVYLKRFPVHAVKIDRSFVMDVDSDGEDRAIVAAIVQLAHALDRHVTAEGIETEEQRVRLTELGCDTGQGFLFSPALAILDFERWCANRHGAGESLLVL